MKTISRKQAVILILAVSLLTAAIFGVFYVTKQNSKLNDPLIEINTTSDEAEIPPTTEEEKQAAEQHKEELIRRQEIENSESTGGQKQVTPVITNAAQNEQQIFVGGYMPGIFENGGVCTFTFTQGPNTLVKTSDAFANASTTDCKNISIARSEFSSGGMWSVVLSYRSPNANGASQAKSLTIQ